MDIIDRINLKLAQAGKTGADMSRALSLSNSIYSQWNTRKTKPSKKTISKIADYLGVTVEYLVSGSGDGQKNIPTPEGEADPLCAEIANQLSDMTNEQLVEILRYVKYVSSRED